MLDDVTEVLPLVGIVGSAGSALGWMVAACRAIHGDGGVHTHL